MEQRKDKEKTLSAGTLLFVACWAAYCASYLGRINYTAALTAIVADGVFSKSHAGFIGTVYFFCYGAGQIFSGILGDRVSPYKMIGAGLAGTVCANIIMPLCSSSYITMSIIWGLNGIVQSMLWTPVLYIIATVLPEEQRSRACLHIASSFPIGSLLSYVISAAAIKFASWHFAFYIPAGIITCVLVFWCICAKKTSKILGKGEKPSLPVHENTGEKISLGKLFMISGASVICVGVLVQGMLKDGVSSWVPTLITEKYDVSASFSLLLSAIMPIINLSGAWIGTKLYEKVFRLNEAATSAFGFAHDADTADGHSLCRQISYRHLRDTPGAVYYNNSRHEPSAYDAHTGALCEIRARIDGRRNIQLLHIYRQRDIDLRLRRGVRKIRLDGDGCFLDYSRRDRRRGVCSADAPLRKICQRKR